MEEKDFKEQVNEIIVRHLDGVEQILSLEDAVKISKENNLNVIGLVNALITKLILVSNDKMFTFEEGTLEKVTNFVEDIALESNNHPIDACFCLLKVLSDMLIQLTVLEELNKKSE